MINTAVSSARLCREKEDGIIMMPLTFAEQGKTYIIKKVSGIGAVSKHLEDIGFASDRPVTIVSVSSGNLIVRVGDTRLALTKEMANKIMI